MGKLLNTTHLSVKESNSILGFANTGSDSWPTWDRFLTVEGKHAYHIGNICDTCAFFFERLEGANRSLSPSEVSRELHAGLTDIDAPFLDTVSRIIPAGEYQVNLQYVAPHLVKPGSEDDYFNSEQIDLWGVDKFWDLPHFPKIAYYRGQSIPMGKGDQLFEFIVPMYPKSWLHQPEIETYRDLIEAKNTPTALAISILDVKQPSDWEEQPAISRHYCLAHYLIDGHHKMYAASQLNKPITLLSFLSLHESIASEEDIVYTTKYLKVSS